MSFTVVLSVLFAAFLHASWNAIIKGGDNKLFEIALVSTGSGVYALVILPFLPPPDPASWPFLAASTFIHFAYHICIPMAYARVDLSYAYTIMRGCAPMFTAIALTIIGTPLPLLGWFGVALLCGGVLTLGVENSRHSSGSMSGTCIALGIALIIMLYTLSDGHGARVSNAPISYTCWMFFINAFPITLYVLWRHKYAFVHYAKQRIAITSVSGLCNMGAYAVALWAMTKAPIAMVAALRETSVIWGMLLGIVFLKERFSKYRMLAVLLVLAGTMLIRLA